MSQIIGLDQHTPKLDTGCTDLQSLERQNIWWGLIILERQILIESETRSWYSRTIFPSDDVFLPSLLDNLDEDGGGWNQCPSTILPVVRSSNIDTFGRQGQVAHFLEQTMSVLTNKDEDYIKISTLKHIDDDIQQLLAITMSEYRGPGSHCVANATALRTLYLINQAVFEISTKNLEKFIPVTFPVYVHGKEHTRWVIRTARANKMVFFAVITAGASICARFPDTIDSSRVINGYNNVSMGQIFALKMAALKHIRHKFTSYDIQDWITVLYSVTCLTVAAIMDGDTHALTIHSKGLRQLLPSTNFNYIPHHVLHVVLSMYCLCSTINGENCADLPCFQYPTPQTPTRAEGTLDGNQNSCSEILARHSSLLQLVWSPEDAPISEL
ncbi:hypothetical protein PV10_04376 [Exophiala mesophila]|uniref:Transcription factor domain-containing protein n=1 Tax=Exophiala mesophila TaxID=212818 RepID=A0A0D2A258_EXOME|nr:uncharacterized protein PV10_04376 [Exophiala mesophila]KIV93138.1 hypothetical protein PV10_04376 [Exophiala mesophila]